MFTGRLPPPIPRPRDRPPRWRPAAAAHQMVVMVLGAPAIDRFPGVGAQRVEHSRRRHRLQCPVDGGQADVLAAPAQFVVQLLGGAELVEGLQKRRNRGSLAGGAEHPGARRAVHRRVTACPRRRGQPRPRRYARGGGRRAGKGLPGQTLPGDHTRRLEDLQMLADQRLGQPRASTSSCTQRWDTRVEHDGDPHRRGQRAQQLAGGVQNLARRRRGYASSPASPSGPCS